MDGVYMGLDNISQVIQKAENILDKLEKDVRMSDRLFDSSVWNEVFKKLQNLQLPEMTVK